MRRHLAAAVGASGALSLIEERAGADAVLVGELTEAGGRLSVDVRLVNVAGRVLWRERVTFEKDASGASLRGAARRMAGRLLRRIKAASGRGRTAPPTSTRPAS
jgi:TolB-like protein